MNILYPADYFKPILVDEMYREEASFFKEHGHHIGTISDEKIIHKNFDKNKLVLFRGWMMTEVEYSSFIESLTTLGLNALTDCKQYLNAHHLPHWYKLIEEDTARTVIVNDLTKAESALRELDWGKFFIKDYVKSLNTSVGSMIDDASKVNILIDEMKKFRGKIEGGLCVRRFEEYKTETETRYFIVKNKAYSPTLNAEVPEIVMNTVNKINSPFFSVDTIENENGDLRIVEIGDGQVSDLTGWEIEKFVSIWS